MFKRSLSLVLLFFCFVFTPLLKSAEIVKLDRDQLIELRTKISEYKKIRDYEARKTLVDDILKMGPMAAVELGNILEKEALALQKKYTVSLGKKAKSIHKKRFKKSQENEVRASRTVLASLRAKGAALGKPEIVEKGDPALEKLKELLLLSATDVISENEKLKSMRKDILVLAEYMKKCNRIIPDDMEKKTRSNKKYGKKDLVPPQEKIPFTTILERNEKLAIVMEILAPKKDIKVLKNNETQTQFIDYKESLGILDLNIMRMLLGLSPLGIDIKLCAAARDHSNDMREKGFFAHESPIKGKKNPADRARNWGTTANGENIAYGVPTPEGTNMQWFHSPGHHVNMLNSEYTVMGLGRSEKHWTQMFRR